MMVANAVAAAAFVAAPPNPVIQAAAASAPPFVAAAAKFVASRRVHIIVSAVLAIPACALLQAGYFVMQYRSKHGATPCPIVPSHGIVTVGAAADELSSSSLREYQDAQLSAMQSLDEADATTGDGYVTKSPGTRLPSSLSQGGNENAAEESLEPPLRLLVIGDSLAAGVGTTNSCTPILPQSIATVVSRDLRRSVQWTCLGEPGASAGWIAKTLESFRDGREGDRRIAGTDNDGGDGKSHWDDWLRERLNLLGHKLIDVDSDDIGQYDVAVVLTGSNDLKFSVLPWMFKDQKQEESVGSGDFASELLNAVEAVANKMKVGIRESLERVRTTVEESFDTIRTSVEEALPSDVIIWANMTGGGLGGDRIVAEDSRVTTTLGEKIDGKSVPPPKATAPKREGRPLVILPALPARNLPVSRWIPLRWIALPLLDIIERAKRRLSELYPSAIVFVDAPERPDFQQYERQEGPIWEKKQFEKDVVSLTDVAKDDCERVTCQMQEFRASKEERGGTGSGGTGALSVQKGRRKFGARFGWRQRNAPREAFLAEDGIHPNDMGYDFWGRYIADKILQEWDGK